jgi:hypothetical protein
MTIENAMRYTRVVMPAKAGIQGLPAPPASEDFWTPVRAGVTKRPKRATYLGRGEA